MKIYVTVVEALRQKQIEDQNPHETQFGTKMMRISEFHPNVLLFFRRSFLKSHPVLDQTQKGSGAVFS